MSTRRAIERIIGLVDEELEVVRYDLVRAVATCRWCEAARDGWYYEVFCRDRFGKGCIVRVCKKCVRGWAEDLREL